MMQAKNIFKYLDKKYNFQNQASWDQSGFIKNGSQSINRILICLDITQQEIDYAIAHQIFLIISHHPIFIDQAFPLQANNYQTLKQLKQHQISTIFLHTAFDRAPQGMNRAIANKLALHGVQCSRTQDYAYGSLKTPLNMMQLAQFVKMTFKLDYVKFIQTHAKCKVNTIAVCGGSGSSLIYEPMDTHVDVLITSDIKHHSWMDAKQIKIKLIEVNHTIENIFIDVIAQDLKEFDQQLKLISCYSNLKFTII